MFYEQALKQLMENKSSRDYPNNIDARSILGGIFPHHRAKFPLKLDRDATIFTIGSCFARNIEEALRHLDVSMPTTLFSVPKSEWPARPNGLLNEYNPGTIAQRIRYATGNMEFPDETIVKNGELYADLLLPGGSDVTLERAIERRNEIKNIYSNLSKSECVIITLGFVESWFDEQTQLFLNRMPPHSVAKSNPNRFIFKRLSIDDCMPMLETALALLVDFDIKIILTVSPVPIQTTFTPDDCVVANEFSKSVLRVCAERLRNQPLIDYFPSYEIARSFGLHAYEDDQVHVKDEVVHEITKYMISIYGERE